MKQLIRLCVNKENFDIYVEPWKILADVLRDELCFMGVKIGCREGECGVCTVIIDGKVMRSCLMLAVQAKGSEIITIEGLAKNGLHPLQRAFIDYFAVQCGFCAPGMILSAKALLDENPNPTEEEVRQALVGNLCRCAGYSKIVEATLAAKEIITSQTS